MYGLSCAVIAPLVSTWKSHDSTFSMCSTGDSPFGDRGWKLKQLQSVRGMHDILPDVTPLWQRVEEQLREVLFGYGYQEIRLPIVEATELFRRSIGDVTDIVEKEMYSFEDRNGDGLSLRPEGTAGCVRAGIEHGLLHNQTQRFWYMGPMFRHERPQKGRYRQFHQLGVEVFGIASPDIEAELLALTARFWRSLGLSGLRLEINTLGTPDERMRYRERLIDYFSMHQEALDPESRRRLSENPLRLLDSKDPGTARVAADAPLLMGDLGSESTEHFRSLCRHLEILGIDFVHNPRLVRGLDYYTRTVFEWITDKMGAQGTVCAGGRYDVLVQQLGGRATPAIGFAMGLERLVGLLEVESEWVASPTLDAYLAIADDADRFQALALAERLREHAPGLRMQVHCGPGSLKAQLKRADRLGAEWVLIVGSQEQSVGKVQMKRLREVSSEQRLATEDEVAETLLAKWIPSNPGVS